MIALGILIVICCVFFAAISSALDLDSRDAGLLMSWGSMLVICSLLLYLGGVFH